MGCISKSLSISALAKKIVNRLLSTLRKPFECISGSSSVLSEKHASLELFCDLMTKQGSHTENETVSLLFHACPPENLEKLKNAFRQAAAHCPANKKKQDMFKNMTGCLKLAIQTCKAVDEIKEGKLGILDLNEVQKNNPDIMAAMLKKNGLDLEHASEELKKHPEIVRIAVEQNWKAISHVDPKVENYKEIILAALRKTPEAFQLVNQETENYSEIASAAVKEDWMAIKYVDANVKNYREIVRATVEKIWANEFKRAPLRTDNSSIDLFCDLMAKQDNGLQYYESRTRTASRFLNACSFEETKKFCEVFEKIAEKASTEHSSSDTSWPRFDNIRKCLKLAVETHDIIQDLNNETIPLYFLTEEHKKNPHIMMAAVRKTWEAIEHVDPTIKNFKDIALVAIEQNYLAIKEIKSTVNHYSDIARAAVKKDWQAIGYINSKIKDYGDIAMAAVKKDWQAIRYINPKIKDYGDIAMAAAKANWRAIGSVNSKVKNYGDIAINAIKKDWRAMRSIDSNVKYDRAIFRTYIEKILIDKFQHAPSEMDDPSLDLFCDFMTGKGNDLKNNVTRSHAASRLFNVCRPKNLQKFCDAFKFVVIDALSEPRFVVTEAGVELGSKSKLRNLNACLGLVIQTSKTIERINAGQLAASDLHEAEKNQSSH